MSIARAGFTLLLGVVLEFFIIPLLPAEGTSYTLDHMPRESEIPSTLVHEQKDYPTPANNSTKPAYERCSDFPKNPDGTLKKLAVQHGVDFVDMHFVAAHATKDKWNGQWFAVAIPVEKTVKKVYCLYYRYTEPSRGVDCSFRQECRSGGGVWNWWDEKVVGDKRIIYVYFEQKTRGQVRGVLRISTGTK